MAHGNKIFSVGTRPSHCHPGRNFYAEGRFAPAAPTSKTILVGPITVADVPIGVIVFVVILCVIVCETDFIIIVSLFGLLAFQAALLLLIY